MKKYLFILLMISCCSWTDPQAERTTTFQCEKNEEVTVTFSEDYEDLFLQLNDRVVVLHRFYTTEEDGYRTEEYLWQSQGNKAQLSELAPTGARPILRKCKRAS